MNHTKVHSQCSVPFLWEEIPGVPKSNFVLHSFNNIPPPTDYNYNGDYSPKISAHKMNIPLPPPCHVQSMVKRSSSFRGLAKQEDDPFAVALKECTKGGRTSGKEAAGSKNVCGGSTTGVRLKGRKSKFGFSCICSDNDVTVDNMVRLAYLPPLPRGKMSPYGGFVNKTSK